MTMALRSILVHLDASTRTPSRVAAAAALAVQHDAHLVGVAPTGWITLTSDWSDGTGVIGYVEAAVQALREQAQAVARQFEQQAAALGVRSIESRVDVGEAAPTLAVHARYCDLTVVTQVEPGRWGGTQSPQLPQEVLMSSGRPLLVLPYAGETPTPLATNVLVGWDASREAARALADALPLLERARSVQVAVFEASQELDIRHGDLPGADIGQWLARHGVRVEVQRIVTGVPVGEALLSHAADLAADLIVVGGYGHSRFRETMLGGVTRTLLRTSPVPVLMSH
jgi:nucleotide-binding universal stress UspA family protein